VRSTAVRQGRKTSRERAGKRIDPTGLVAAAFLGLEVAATVSVSA